MRINRKGNSGNLVCSIVKQIRWVAAQDIITVQAMMAACGLKQSTVRYTLGHFVTAGVLERTRVAAKGQLALWKPLVRVIEIVDFDKRCIHGLAKASCARCRGIK